MHGTANSRVVDRLRTAARVYLFGKTWRNYRLMQAIVNTFYPNIAESVKNKKCPFCGKVFKTRAAVYAHIGRSHRNALSNVVEDCVEKYLALLRSIVAYTGSVNCERKEVIKIKGFKYRFTGTEQLVNFLMKNPDIVKKAINR